MKTVTKTQLRNQIRVQKRAMTPVEISEKSAALTAQFLRTSHYQNAKTIYGYINNNQEVQTRALLEQALRDGKQVALAKCYGSDMRFIYTEDLTQITKSSSGIPEPIDDEPVADDETALVLMPGLAFDLQGHRLGYGGGYYDKFLSAQPHHPTVALCFDFQILDHLDTDPHDVPVDLVLWA